MLDGGTLSDDGVALGHPWPKQTDQLISLCGYSLLVKF